MRSAILLWCLIGLAACEVRGVAPEKQHLYQAKPNGKWACLNDSSIELSLDQINDDYCDCPDGSDEPGTNACPFSADAPQYFYCANAGHKPGYIENYEVNDGVCDYDVCCDGSDEYRGGNCPSVCAQVAEQLAKYVADTKKRLDSALEVRGRLEEKARQARAEVEQRVLETASQVQSGEERLRDLTQDFERAKSLGTSENSAAVALSSDISERMRILEQKASDMAQILADKDRQLAVLESYLEDLRVNYNPNFNDLAVKRAVNSYADYTSNKDGDSKSFVVDPKDYRVDQILAKIKSLQAPIHEMVPSVKSIFAYYLGKTASSASKGSSSSGMNEKSQKIADDMKSLEQKVKTLKSEEDMYRADLDSNYGPSDIFRSVQGSWINKKIGDYNYRLGFLDSLYQDNTLVGRFDGFDGNVMQYSHGSKCWNGPHRSAKIDMECGPANELLSVSEPEKCQYRFLISSPLACEDLADDEIAKGFKVDRSSI